MNQDLSNNEISSDFDPDSTLESVQPSVVRLPWRSVAGVAGLIAVASLAALAVVSASKSADALATVALVLAIIAFVLQVMIFVFQAKAAGEQELRARKLQSDTETLLAEVSATVKTTEWLVKEQLSSLLESFKQASEKTATESKIPDPEKNAERTMDNLSEAVTSKSAQEEEPGSATAPTPRRATVRRRPNPESTQKALRQARRGLRVSSLKTFPPEDQGVESIHVLKNLTPEERERLLALAQDAQNVAVTGSYEGLEPDSEDGSLISKGLATKVRRMGGTLTGISDDGLRHARILMGEGEIPKWAEEAVDQFEKESNELPDTSGDIPF